MIGFGAFPNEVIEALYSKNALSVIGNLDLEILDKNKKGKGIQEILDGIRQKRVEKISRNLSSRLAFQTRA